MKRTTAAGGAVCALAVSIGSTAFASSLTLGNLLVSGSVYEVPAGSPAANLKVGDTLPGGGKAVADGTYPNVFKNEGPDASFGVTTPIELKQYWVKPGGASATLSNTQLVTGAGGVSVATSFPSKSELALNLSTNGKAVTFLGYVSPSGNLDVSNSNTPGHLDPTNAVKSQFQRAVIELDRFGNVSITPVNAYSGNNGRAVTLANDVNGSKGVNSYYLVGNAGNGSGTEPAGVMSNTGVQMTTPGGAAETTVVGQLQGGAGCPGVLANGCQYGFAVQSLGYPADKSGKDDNFRGETIFNNTLYVTKGSGGNGIDTVYQVGKAGTLPTAADASSAAISILPGFPTGLASNIVTDNTKKGWSGGITDFHPFGLWFANATTLYVADEGSGNNVVGKDDPTTNPNAGLEKWSFDGSKWLLDYTLGVNNGLLTGVGYTPDGYCGPVYTDGLRNITGRTNADGTVTIFGITSTVSCATDQGADPNYLVDITDTLGFTKASDAAGERFVFLDGASHAEVFRGVSLTPVPEPASLVLFGCGALGLVWRRRSITKSAAAAHAARN